SNNTNGPALEWWKTAIYLTLAERKVLNGLYSELKDMDQLSRDTHMTLLQVVSAIQSAFKKRQLSEKEVRPVTS
ncbi:MAG: hypothetical protein Q7R53_00725, partial [bacterium]|nr:hypothetical protein [bacterium]